MPDPTDEAREKWREDLKIAFGMTKDAVKPINAGGIDPDLWQDQAVASIEAALTARETAARSDELRKSFERGAEWAANRVLNIEHRFGLDVARAARNAILAALQGLQRPRRLASE